MSTGPTTLQVTVNAPIGALRINASIQLAAPWSVLFGPSGSGKSSLLRLIAGLWQPTDASVTIDGENITPLPPHKRHVALVAQQVALFPHLTVRQNIAFGCTDPAWLSQLIETFHLTTLASAKPATLSGGERQRVAIARALASRPRYLLLDEVFTGMHTPLRQELIALLRTCAIPTLSVTHDVAEALQADEVITIERGSITAQGHPAKVLATEVKALQHQLARPTDS